MPGKPAYSAFFLVSSGKKDNKERDNMESWNLKPQVYPALVLCGLAAETSQDFLKTTCLLQLHMVQSAWVFGSNPSHVNTDSIWESVLWISPQRITDAVRTECHTQTFDAF